MNIQYSLSINARSHCWITHPVKYRIRYMWIKKTNLGSFHWPEDINSARAWSGLTFQTGSTIFTLSVEFSWNLLIRLKLIDYYTFSIYLNSLHFILYNTMYLVIRMNFTLHSEFIYFCMGHKTLLEITYECRMSSCHCDERRTSVKFIYLRANYIFV